jgi:signal transduction histidine kinase
MSSIEADIAAIQRISAVPTILKVVSEATGLRLALVARVTEGSWTCCAVLDRMGFGMNVGDRLEVATTLCSEVRAEGEPIVIEHASSEPAFCDHPAPKLYGFESYIATPIIRPDGTYFGNVCALDSNPTVLRDGKTLEMVKLFADLIGTQLEAEETYARERAALSDERRTAELREQFIAVLGHDLRNPLTSVVTGADFLLELDPTPTQRTILERVVVSGRRMARLIDDVLDFARGRLGGGMPIDPMQVEDVGFVVRHVVAEVAAAHPEREIRVQTDVASPAWFDRTRVGQMLSNLVGNAVEHSPEGEAVDVVVDAPDGLLRFAVTNHGEPIADELLPRIFHPYARGKGVRPRSGLGLGLYIASEIARAHGGAIQVASCAEQGTTFTAVIPRAAPS